ncbi:MAG TPA: VanW family protein [Fimbriimonas sp.]|nr:VanW family protein [Fimbriimonas sp.]
MLQLIRWYTDVRTGLPRHRAEASLGRETSVFEHRSRLWRSSDPRELGLELGKVQNLRVAAGKLNGVVVPAGQLFSFWKQVGRATRRRGYVDGRELQEGCIVPAIGGGICQLSNALYSLAASAGMEIVERHPHTQVVPGSEAEAGRDATVAWNHIDLRFRCDQTFQIQAFLTQTELVVRFVSGDAFANVTRPKKPLLNVVQSSVGSCETCGEVGCFRHNVASASVARSASEGRAFVVDAVWPEFQKLLLQSAHAGDTVLLPIEGARLRLERYAWQVPGGARVLTATLGALKRTWNSRRSLPPPAKRALALADTDSVANRLGQLLPFNARQVTVDIGYCSELYRRGDLGGREVTIWFTRFPLKLVHQLLDEAQAVLPESKTISDFRADESRVEAEWQAILGAVKLVTPHPYLADWLRKNTTVPVELIEWVLPKVVAPAQVEPGLVYFPGPTIAREGAYALRNAAQSGGVQLAVGGKNLEDPSFWSGVELVPGERVDSEVVVIPAVFQNRPVVGLKAVAMGKRVVATATCGIPGAEVVTFGDSEALLKLLTSG